MNEEKKGFIAWVKAHKKELITAGVSVAVIIAIILGIKNKDALLELWGSLRLRASVAKSPAPVRELHDITPVTPEVSIIETEKIPVSEATEMVRSVQYPFGVSEHIRNLHPGWKASAEKMAEAERLGIMLLPGQTIVDGYTKGGLAA